MPSAKHAQRHIHTGFQGFWGGNKRVFPPTKASIQYAAIGRVEEAFMLFALDASDFPFCTLH